MISKHRHFSVLFCRYTKYLSNITVISIYKSNYTDDYLIFRFCQPAGDFVLCQVDNKSVTKNLMFYHPFFQENLYSSTVLHGYETLLPNPCLF